ncbi:conserved phage C-terminal domain-containing protein [Terrisporobacter petrolearius]|uniref:conserved phage C-terminal domain-containing protein n=1 Tax=Terrisporobacter petrolearius TaxID=1460447 RepID=UPI001D16BA06|nr:conserved phage C-terminal domain-containing protein [Terrisporobacter petrolearius]
MQQGYIKLHRKIKDNSLWKACTPNRKVIMVTMLLSANHKRADIVLDNGEKTTILPGQFITSRRNFAKECGKGITEQMIRSAWVVFQKQGFSTIKTTKDYTLVTIENWGIYQDVLKKRTQESTQGQPSTNLRSTMNNNDKNEENEKKDNIYTRVITRLNEKASKNFKSTTQKTKTSIDARLRDGFIEEDFYKVIEIKTKEWLDTKYEKYLRPETLFGPKFEGYLNQSTNKQVTTKSSVNETIENIEDINFKPRPQYIEDELEKKRKEYGLL